VLEYEFGRDSSLRSERQMCVVLLGDDAGVEGNGRCRSKKTTQTKSPWLSELRPVVLKVFTAMQTISLSSNDFLVLFQPF
ncbi:MAG: hypothetical protein KC445_05985, partial [Anaerolineales bacterium]|nr:hypothetical protein [Anaerolineales bacterium]